MKELLTTGITFRPSSVKLSSSVDMFKCYLEAYKISSIDNRFQASTNCYWEVSEHVLSRIERPSALAGRSALCEYWSENSWVAKKKGVNRFTSSANSHHVVFGQCSNMLVYIFELAFKL